VSGTVQDLGVSARTAALVDIVALAKPRILMLVMITATGGLMLAPGVAALPVAISLLVGTALIVGSANALNMYLEREIDCHMARTRNRPLPAGRMEPGAALVFGLGLALTGVPILTFGVNPLTGMLGVIAHLSYVLVYTPLKQRTPAAVWVGAVPGAMPPLLGWTAVTEQLTWGALAVFGLMLLWQVPHFHAIAMFRVEEYRRAGLKTLPGERGADVARRSIALVLVAQLAVSVAIFAFGVAGYVYLAAALVLGVGYLFYGLKGYMTAGGPAWARKLFFISLVYLPVIFAALVLDGRL
jgi:protoheme IX farnesyltransferase